MARLLPILCPVCYKPLFAVTVFLLSVLAETSRFASPTTAENSYVHRKNSLRLMERMINPIAAGASGWRHGRRSVQNPIRSGEKSSQHADVRRLTGDRFNFWKRILFNLKSGCRMSDPVVLRLRLADSRTLSKEQIIKRYASNL